MVKGRNSWNYIFVDLVIIVIVPIYMLIFTAMCSFLKLSTLVCREWQGHPEDFLPKENFAPRKLRGAPQIEQLNFHIRNLRPVRKTFHDKIHIQHTYTHILTHTHTHTHTYPYTQSHMVQF